MNRPAIDDLLGGILSGWYESVADWVPPGQASAETCGTCASSILADAVDLAAWPHDLMHQLATSLETASLQIFDSLIVSVGLSYDSVRRHVSERVREQSHDLIDVLRECVAPRLDAWVADELNRAFAEAGPIR